MTEDEKPATQDQQPAERKGINRWLIIALVAAVLAGILLASSVWQSRSSGEGNSAGSDTAEESDPDLESWCAAQATYDAIRRELFRRAAQVRGSDEQAYGRLADYALLRVSSPVARGIDEQLRSVTCTGTGNLDLPPGVAVAGGRRSLSGDLEYTIQPAADGTGNVIRIGSADAIVVPLATLARTGTAQGTPLSPPAPQTPIDQPVGGEPGQFPDVPAEPEPQRPVAANPSFDCDDARTRGEIAVCGDPGLAALDRQMAAQYNAAASEADSRQRALLQRTRSRFLGYRDRCANSACVAQTYQSRMREISDIMANRWRG